MKKNTVHVYDTISKKVVEVEVNDEVRTHYNRTQWNINDNNESFYKHEIQFSSLIGGYNGAFENFHEFVTDKDIVEQEIMLQIEYNELLSALKSHWVHFRLSAERPLQARHAAHGQRYAQPLVVPSALSHLRGEAKLYCPQGAKADACDNS